MAYRSVNPFDGKTLETFEEIGDEELDKAVRTAERCFGTWRARPFADRAGVLRRAAHTMRSRIEELARPVTLEMGKLINESRAEVRLSADIFEYFAGHSERFLAPQKLETPSGEAVLEKAPLGVLFGVQPWNFPYYQLARFVAPNLMAGNVVMVKHASSVPRCALAFAQLLEEAGAPAGAYTNLFVSKSQVARLIDDPRVKGVALTGSDAAGATVAAQSGKALKKSTMELGGSDPFLVLDDADVDEAVAGAMWGRFHNAGQSCVASKRLIVVASIAGRFVEKLQVAMGRLRMGNPLDEVTTLAPLSSRDALDRLADQIERAVAKGARIAMGGKRVEGAGAFLQPTLLTDIQPGNPAYSEELFGPVALFFRVPDEDAAVALANDSPFGLGASVFTRDVERGKRVARRIESGMVFINRATWTAPELPFGGIKRSGYGRELSHLGIQEFVNQKLIRVTKVDAPY
jgi:succinate-semialdehyde dehydrogenase/glutarate-semialdehyde dehydrogenase